ncbi:unnamed protein product [Ambrosiozyma monospora]|uniref:Unnamed protein product n=1 Tax=Ambrosiozyma monospora TaxID=43982 RepID=A0A9W7DHW5_AMBMO|nr:unnamed protein product [Ambrosiozyma monospora]
MPPVEVWPTAKAKFNTNINNPILQTFRNSALYLQHHQQNQPQCYTTPIDYVLQSFPFATLNDTTSPTPDPVPVIIHTFRHKLRREKYMAQHSQYQLLRKTLLSFAEKEFDAYLTNDLITMDSSPQQQQQQSGSSTTSQYQQLQLSIPAHSTSSPSPESHQPSSPFCSPTSPTPPTSNHPYVQHPQQPAITEYAEHDKMSIEQLQRNSYLHYFQMTRKTPFTTDNTKLDMAKVFSAEPKFVALSKPHN